MSARNDLNTTLVIRARDEAQRTIDAISGALDGLFTSQKRVADGSGDTAAGLGQIASVLATVDRAYAGIASAAKQGEQAFGRQNNAIAENKAALASLQQQQAAAARSAENLRVAIVDAMVGGTDAGPIRAQLTAVTAAMAKLDADAGRLQRTIDQQASGFTRSASSLAELERTTRLAGAVSAFAAQGADDYAAALKRQNAEAERAAQVQAAIRRSQYQDSGKSAERSAGVFSAAGPTAFERETAAAAAAEADAIAKLRREVDPLAAIQARLNRELDQAAAWYRAGKISATELAQAQLLLKKNADQAAQSLGRQTAGGAGKGFMGLRSYELTNLGYQINDIVAQLASGTSLTQTLAQQGGQLLQIFPRVGSSILAAFSNPVILSAAAVVGSFAFGMKAAGDEAERLRGFLGQLAASADGGSYGAEKLSEAARALDAYGLSAEDAVEAVRIFLREGVDQDRIEELGRVASDVADVMGIDLKTRRRPASTQSRPSSSCALQRCVRSRVRTSMPPMRATRLRLSVPPSTVRSPT